METRPLVSHTGCQNLFGCVVRLHVVFLLREDDVENSVGAAAGLVHVGRSHSPKRENYYSSHHVLLTTDSCVDASESPVTWPCFPSPSGPGCRCMR